VPAQTYWDHPIQRLGPTDDLQFMEFFDFDQSGLLVNPLGVVKEILEHLGQPGTGPPVAPARIAAEGEDAPWQNDVPESQEPLR
jgi:hypothetical protein